MAAGVPIMSGGQQSGFESGPAVPRWTRGQRAVLLVARWLGPIILGLLGRSWRIELPDGLPPGARAHPPATAIWVFWHRCLLPIAWEARGFGYGVLISQHYDGEVVARVAEGLGYRLFRGSSTRGGREAVGAMAEALKEGCPVALTVDGPRGPRFQAKGGAIRLAQLTGLPIFALHAAPEKSWTLKSWDRFQVPKPGSRVRGYWSGPMYVPAEAGPEESERLRLEMEATLNRLRRRGEEEMGEES
jgi:lysophospholipid acyltransferase (LPLAT)-like uncharacterized protein